jgi:gamma-glutamyltranspeptidase/glutathione hydrolase
VRAVEDDEQGEVLVGGEAMLVARCDEERTTLLESGRDALDFENASAVEDDVDLVEIVGLLAVGLGRNQHVDADLETRRRMDDLISAPSLGKRLAGLVHVERVHRQEPIPCDAGSVRLDLDALFQPGAGVANGWRRMPAVAGEAMIATSHPLATAAGLRAFERGGNAVDAALAAAAVLTVAEPTDNGIGGDAFALVWHEGALYGLNGSGRSPAGLDGQRHAERGPRSVTVPGAVRAWADLAERFGSFGLTEPLEHAAELAENGIACSPRIADKWSGEQDAPWPAPHIGERYRLPELAATLRRISTEGPDALYDGVVAEAIGSCCWLSEDDLASHQSEWVEPLRLAYRGVDVCELPPNGQGAAALIALGLYAGLEPSLHSQIEAMKLALADVYAHVADQPLPSLLLDPTHLAGRRALIRPDRACDMSPSVLPRGGTTYLCAVDRDGTAISLIQSLYETFGSGVVAPGTGIVLQNRAAGFAAGDDHPNRLAPRKRPFHTIIPGMLLTDGELLGPLGVMGGAMQPQGHFQVVQRLVDEEMDPQAALDAPRWRVAPDSSVQLEPGLWDRENELRALGHVVQRATVQHPFGVGQAILKLGDGWIGGSDGRGDGFAGVL